MSLSLIAEFLDFCRLFVKIYKRTDGAVLFTVAVFEEEISVRLGKQSEQCFFFDGLQAKTVQYGRS